jgi:hypothetical protein
LEPAVILNAEEVLTRIQARLEGQSQEVLALIPAKPLGLKGVEVAPLALDDDQVGFNACLSLLADIEKYELTTLNDVLEEAFPPFAQAILNILSLYHEIIHTDRFEPAVSVGAKLFHAYYERNGVHADLAYQLGEEIREFPLPYHASWLNEYIARFHTKAFTQFSVETLTHMAQHSLKFRQSMLKDDHALKTVIFGTSSDFLLNNGCYTSPFLSALVCSSVNVPATMAQSLHTKVIDSEMRALALQLLRLEGIDVKVACVAVDYLLVGELIERFRKAYDTTTNNPLQRERYVRACALLVDLFVMDLDEPTSSPGSLFRKAPEGVVRIEERVFTALLKGFGPLFNAWSKHLPLQESMDRFRRVVVGSVLHSHSAFVKRSASIEVAEPIISAMFAHCKEDVNDPVFLKFIGKPGRLNVASRISSFNDPEFQKAFIKNHKELRGAVLESELGL